VKTTKDKLASPLDIHPVAQIGRLIQQSVRLQVMLVLLPNTLHVMRRSRVGLRKNVIALPFTFTHAASESKVSSLPAVTPSECATSVSVAEAAIDRQWTWEDAHR
jgi:hypothetical protein